MMKSIIKDLAPPFLWRWIKNFKPHTNMQQNDQEQNSDFYDLMFSEHDHWKQHYTASGYYPLWTIIADRILRMGGRSVLDIGCGPGQFSLLLRDKGICNYIGIDSSPQRIKHAKTICSNFVFKVEDVYYSDVFDEHDYDTVVCLEFLEHVDHDIEVLEKIRTGTKFFGTVPNFPFKAHVRHFRNSQEVMARYGKNS